MKLARTILILFLGMIIGTGVTIGIQKFRRAQAIKSLPSLADRSSYPLIDEIPSVRLSREEGRLIYDVRDGMGTPRKDFQTLFELDWGFPNSELIVAIFFDPGVTSEDLEATVSTLSTLGVKRYFIGNSIYGKSLK